VRIGLFQHALAHPEAFSNGGYRRLTPRFSPVSNKGIATAVPIKKGRPKCRRKDRYLPVRQEAWSFNRASKDGYNKQNFP